MKKTIVFMALVLFSFIPFFSHTAVSAPIELKWANYFPVPSMQSKICEQFIKELEPKLQGKVKFSYFTAGTLLTAPKIYDGVVQELRISDFLISLIHMDALKFRNSLTSLSVSRMHGLQTMWQTIFSRNSSRRNGIRST